jgi:hypothetical protein
LANYKTRAELFIQESIFWLPENTTVHALFDGEVVIVENDIGDKEYGLVVLVKHQQKIFFALYL